MDSALLQNLMAGAGSSSQFIGGLVVAVLYLERFPLRLNRDSQSGRKGGVSGRDSPSGGCPYGQAVFVGFA